MGNKKLYREREGTGVDQVAAILPKQDKLSLKPVQAWKESTREKFEWAERRRAHWSSMTLNHSLISYPDTEEMESLCSDGSRNYDSHCLLSAASAARTILWQKLKKELKRE